MDFLYIYLTPGFIWFHRHLWTIEGTIYRENNAPILLALLVETSRAYAIPRCPSVRPSVRPSVCKQFLLSHLLWGYISQRLHYGPSLLALWCSCAPAILIMILSCGAPQGAWPFSLCKSCYRIFSYTIYLRHLVRVSIWWQGGIDVHLWFWWGSVFQGPSKECGQFSLYKSM